MKLDGAYGAVVMCFAFAASASANLEGQRNQAELDGTLGQAEVERARQEEHIRLLRELPAGRFLTDLSAGRVDRDTIGGVVAQDFGTAYAEEGQQGIQNALREINGLAQELDIDIRFTVMDMPAPMQQQVRDQLQAQGVPQDRWPNYFYIVEIWTNNTGPGRPQRLHSFHLGSRRDERPSGPPPGFL